MSNTCSSFIQFLKDVGVDATAEIEEQAGRVLFAITPKDPSVALGKIREALDVYLELAKRRSNDIVPLNADIEIQRMAAEVDHIRSQLRLAHIMVTQQDRLLAQKDELIQQQQLLSGQILISSLQPPVPAASAEPEEPLIGDLVTVKPFEVYGVKFSSPP